jgi:hypothetical protein
MVVSMSASRHDELIAELYGLPIDEFTSARDALAKRLRADGEREVAKQVKVLRKPSVTAWAVNRVRHREPERVEELLEAGARLRQAQEQVIRAGEHGQLRDAGARERDLVQSLGDRRTAIGDVGEQEPTPALRAGCLQPSGSELATEPPAARATQLVRHRDARPC